ncbi:MAG: magnesium/cobalt transporter CorA [Candidatus Eisenbacteria bacterium]|nr:magnesium/cobalt transporter CorA [Candidatus Eisenbacteria bacterium]
MSRWRKRTKRRHLTEKRRSKKAGLPPGSLVHIGEQRQAAVVLSVLDYDEEGFREQIPVELPDACSFRDSASVTWINVDGLHDPEVVQRLCDHFGIHPLVQEDILNTDQRPKMEEFDTYIYAVLNMIYCHAPHDEIEFEQVSLIIGANFLLTFQEAGGDVFDPLRQRIRENQGAVRKNGSDYLAYRLIDAIVDNYFVVGEKLGERIEAVEEILIDRPEPASLHELHLLKRDTIRLRKAVWPLREMLASFSRGESRLVQAGTLMYFRDVYDHCVQMIDTIETDRDVLSGLLDLYLSSQNNRLNEVMKVLAVISTIFIPLSFVAGVYGMNFQDMPELRWKYGYPAALVMMGAVALVLLLWFRRKRWI